VLLQYLPRVRAYCQQVVSTDWDAMPMADLPAAMDEVVAGSVEAFRLTMVVVRSFMGPTIQLAMWAERELGADASTLIGTVLQGFDNHTSSAGKGLGELAEMVARTPELAAAIRAGNSDLSSVDGGPDFLAAFDRYLEDFGWRLESWSFLDTPTWYEDRSVPLQLIRQYLENPSTNPAEAIARAATQREAALKEVESGNVRIIQAGDRTLAASASEILCFNVSLPSGTGNAYQGLTSTATFAFQAEQTTNNP